MFAVIVHRKIPCTKSVNTDNLLLKTMLCIQFKSCTNIIFNMNFSSAYKLAIVCSWIIGNINYAILELYVGFHIKSLFISKNRKRKTDLCYVNRVRWFVCFMFAVYALDYSVCPFNWNSSQKFPVMIINISCGHIIFEWWTKHKAYP